MPFFAAITLVLAVQGVPKTTVKHVDGYTITSRSRPGDRYDTLASVIVKDRRGKVILTVKDWAADLVWIQDFGDGVKVADISAYSGGAHCCEVDYFLRLGAHPRLLAKYDMGNVSGCVFHKSGRYIETSYDGFAYYHASYVDSARLPMYFKVKDGRLVDATLDFPAALEGAYRQSLDTIKDNLADYESSVVKKELSGGGLFGNDLGGSVVQAYAVSVLLGKEKRFDKDMAGLLYREDLEAIASLKSEIAAIAKGRSKVLSYPSLPYKHDGGMPS